MKQVSKPLPHPSSLKWRNSLGEPILLKKLVSLNTRMAPEPKEKGREAYAQASPVTSVSGVRRAFRVTPCDSGSGSLHRRFLSIAGEHFSSKRC